MKKISLFALFTALATVNVCAEDLWTETKHVSWTDGGIQIGATAFQNAQPGNLLKVSFTSATDGIEFKVMNEHFDHLAGSREAAWIEGDGAFEQFLTQSAVDSLKAYGLEVIGANFTCTKIELLDGKVNNLKEGFTVWTGFFWADEWSTLELYWNGYAAVDWTEATALRIYSEANRSDFVINVILNAWPDKGGENVANQEAMTAGEGYMELPLTDELRTKLAEASKWMVQFNKEQGAAFNVTDIVLVMNNETAIDHTAAGEKATKTFVNGQLVIEKNGKFYDALGAEL